MRSAPTRLLRKARRNANERRRASRERQLARAAGAGAWAHDAADRRLARWRRGSCITLACASALQSFSPKRGDVTDAGRRGLPSRDVGSGEERRRTGSPREAGRGARGALCAAAQVQVCYAPTLRRSPVRRAPQRSRAKAAGRSRPRTHERARPPRHPAPRGLRTTRHAGKALLNVAKRRRRRHDTPHQPTAATTAGVDPATARRMTNFGGAGSCDFAQDDKPWRSWILRLRAG